jgi:hypothetical protein
VEKAVKALAAIAPPVEPQLILSSSESESEEEVKSARPKPKVRVKPTRVELLGKAMLGYEKDMRSIDTLIQGSLNRDIFNCKQRYIGLFKKSDYQKG